jgi:hypothetical protein
VPEKKQEAGWKGQEAQFAGGLQLQGVPQLAGRLGSHAAMQCNAALQRMQQ